MVETTATSGTRDCVVLLSGGIDSAVVLAQALAHGLRPHALGINYGQRHRRELIAARAVAAHYGAPYREAVCTLPACGLTGTGDVSGPLAVVPGRNLALISLAVAHAAVLGAGEVLVGCHAGDRELFPDCREGFLDDLSRACVSAYGVAVRAPFLWLGKHDVVACGRRHKVPFGLTWSCYQGGETPCGCCVACVTRAAAGADD